MKKTLYISCLLACLCSFDAFAQTTKTTVVKSPVVAKPQTARPQTAIHNNTVRPQPAKPHTTTTTVTHPQNRTSTVQPAVTTRPAVVQSTTTPINIHHKEETKPDPVQSSHSDQSATITPARITSDKPEPRTHAAPGINREAVLIQSYLDYRYGNLKQAKRSNRHCGCGGDIVIENPTNDSLDIYLAYYDSEDLPTLQGTAMPFLRNNATFPNFVIGPHDSITLRGSCKGGLRYEVVNHTARHRGKKMKFVPVNDPSFLDEGYIRFSCISQSVMLSNDLNTK